MVILTFIKQKQEFEQIIREDEQIKNLYIFSQAIRDKWKRHHYKRPILLNNVLKAKKPIIYLNGCTSHEHIGN